MTVIEYNLAEKEIINATRDFAIEHKIHYDEMTESMVRNAIRELRLRFQPLTSDETTKQVLP